MENNKYYYGRVSTEAQSLLRQIDMAKNLGIDDENVYMEKMTGTKKHRPQLDRLLKEIEDEKQLGRSSTLYIESLSRLGRSTKDLLELIERLMLLDCTLVSSKEQIDTSTAVGRLLTTLLCALAEFERDLTVERTQNGLSASRARGRVGGRPPVNKKDLKIALSLYDSKEYSISEICKRCGVSQGTLYSTIRKRNMDVAYT
ncbi:Site-specific DNA recombinase [Anaerocolumna jejuensis DSM 15929]|uniref:Site-specific DNA recombinase n=1 Tax=Anaerocolumna jejuensis DSM 15929 TaxID=1121322 RepID=A0A1M6KF39_9FIRM|nr:recombinase family protein [Anaerocolumna jejuensis]SHJ57576.1 Site-specific DNA recombinase [Anaerocolumna jejuensis DSM 15929]